MYLPPHAFGIVASRTAEVCACAGATWSALVTADPEKYGRTARSEEHTSELQSQSNLVCRLLLEKKKTRPAHPVQDAAGQPCLGDDRGHPGDLGLHPGLGGHPQHCHPVLLLQSVLSALPVREMSA